MGKESYVEVSGPRDIAELADRVREVLRLPEGALRRGRWQTAVPGGVAPAVFVEPVEYESGYDYQVMIYTGRLADGQGRQLFDGLAASTGWALCLLDDDAVPLAERPAVSRAS